jgi:sarcosine oxidase, subunit beta
VVVAAGPWSPPLLAGAGFVPPVIPRHRQVYRADGVHGLFPRCPFVVDLGTGVYFHPDGPGLVFGGGDRDGSPGYDESFRTEDAPRIICPDAFPRCWKHASSAAGPGSAT